MGVQGGHLVLVGCAPKICRAAKPPGNWNARILMDKVGVTNFIRVVPAPVSISLVRSGIEAAMQRHALLDAHRISVETADGTVTLRGAVHTIAERRVATCAAWSAPGVKHVKDELVVEA